MRVAVIDRLAHTLIPQQIKLRKGQDAATMGFLFYQTFGSLPVILCRWEEDPADVVRPSVGELIQPRRASAFAIARSMDRALAGSVSTT